MTQKPPESLRRRLSFNPTQNGSSDLDELRRARYAVMGRIPTDFNNQHFDAFRQLVGTVALAIMSTARLLNRYGFEKRLITAHRITSLR